MTGSHPACEDLTLDGIVMRVSATTSESVVDGATLVMFSQRLGRVIGRYQGGSIRRGRLVGTLSKGRLEFRYAQVEANGAIHGGRSTCEVVRSVSGALRITERFTWRTRAGSGVNVFEEAPRAEPASESACLSR